MDIKPVVELLALIEWTKAGDAAAWQSVIACVHPRLRRTVAVRKDVLAEVKP